MTDIVERLREYDPTRANSREAAAEIERLRALLRRHQAAAKFRLSPACDLAVETCAALAGEEPKLISLEDDDDWPVLEACAEIERLRAALQGVTDLCKFDPADPFLADKMDRLARAALEPKP